MKKRNNANFTHPYKGALRVLGVKVLKALKTKFFSGISETAKKVNEKMKKTLHKVLAKSNKQFLYSAYQVFKFLFPLSAKPLQSRMGKGKASIKEFIDSIQKARITFAINPSKLKGKLENVLTTQMVKQKNGYRSLKQFSYKQIERKTKITLYGLLEVCIFVNNYILQKFTQYNETLNSWDWIDPLLAELFLAIIKYFFPLQDPEIVKKKCSYTRLDDFEPYRWPSLLGMILTNNCIQELLIIQINHAKENKFFTRYELFEYYIKIHSEEWINYFNEKKNEKITKIIEKKNLILNMTFNIISECISGQYVLTCSQKILQSFSIKNSSTYYTELKLFSELISILLFPFCFLFIKGITKYKPLMKTHLHTFLTLLLEKSPQIFQYIIENQKYWDNKYEYSKEFSNKKINIINSVKYPLEQPLISFQYKNFYFLYKTRTSNYISKQYKPKVIKNVFKQYIKPNMRILKQNTMYKTLLILFLNASINNMNNYSAVFIKNLNKNKKKIRIINYGEKTKNSPIQLSNNTAGYDCFNNIRTELVENSKDIYQSNNINEFDFFLKKCNPRFKNKKKIIRKINNYLNKQYFWRNTQQYDYKKDFVNFSLYLEQIIAAYKKIVMLFPFITQWNNKIEQAIIKNIPVGNLYNENIIIAKLLKDITKSNINTNLFRKEKHEAKNTNINILDDLLINARKINNKVTNYIKILERNEKNITIQATNNIILLKKVIKLCTEKFNLSTNTTEIEITDLIARKINEKNEKFIDAKPILEKISINDLKLQHQKYLAFHYHYNRDVGRPLYSSLSKMYYYTNKIELKLVEMKLMKSLPLIIKHKYHQEAKLLWQQAYLKQANNILGPHLPVRHLHYYEYFCYFKEYRRIYFKETDENFLLTPLSELDYFILDTGAKHLLINVSRRFFNSMTTTEIQRYNLAWQNYRERAGDPRWTFGHFWYWLTMTQWSNLGVALRADQPSFWFQTKIDPRELAFSVESQYALNLWYKDPFRYRYDEIIYPDENYEQQDDYGDMTDDDEDRYDDSIMDEPELEDEWDIEFEECAPEENPHETMIQELFDFDFANMPYVEEQTLMFTQEPTLEVMDKRLFDIVEEKYFHVNTEHDSAKIMTKIRPYRHLFNTGTYSTSFVKYEARQKRYEMAGVRRREFELKLIPTMHVKRQKTPIYIPKENQKHFVRIKKLKKFRKKNIEEQLEEENEADYEQYFMPPISAPIEKNIYTKYGQFIGRKVYDPTNHETTFFNKTDEIVGRRKYDFQTHEFLYFNKDGKLLIRKKRKSMNRKNKKN